MIIAFKFLFAAGFVFALAALRAAVAYAAWSVSLNDGIARSFQRSRDGCGGTRKIYHPDL
jgi:hypothetical protein